MLSQKEFEEIINKAISGALPIVPPVLTQIFYSSRKIELLKQLIAEKECVSMVFMSKNTGHLSKFEIIDKERIKDFKLFILVNGICHNCSIGSNGSIEPPIKIVVGDKIIVLGFKYADLV